MWKYEKKLQYPVNIKNPNPKLAKFIVSQLGGPDGEIAASLRYLNQRFSAPYNEVRGLLTDIGVSVTILPPFFFAAFMENIHYHPDRLWRSRKPSVRAMRFIGK